MRRIKRNITEKWLFPVIPDEFDRPAGQDIGQVTLALLLPSVILDRTVKIMAPMAAAKTEKLLEAAAIGMVGIL